MFYVFARTEESWNVSGRICDIENHSLKKGWSDIFDNTFGKMLGRVAHLYNSCNDNMDGSSAPTPNYIIEYAGELLIDLAAIVSMTIAVLF